MSRRGRLASGIVGVVALAVAADAGHESPFYPSFYPQEIKIERVAPAAAVPDGSSSGHAPDVGCAGHAERR